jgi:hypothetical protein
MLQKSYLNVSMVKSAILRTGWEDTNIQEAGYNTVMLWRNRMIVLFGQLTDA